MARTSIKSEIRDATYCDPLRTGDVRQLAGLLEGEGCFRIDGRNNISIALQMCDEDVVRWAARILRYPRSISRIHFDNPKYNDQHKIIVQGNAAAQWMMTLYPLMGKRRKERMHGCLVKWRSLIWQKKFRRVCPKGHRYDGSYRYINSQGKRKTGIRCKKCAAEILKAHRDRKRLFLAEA